MATCKDCIHQKSCINWARMCKGNERSVEDIVRQISEGEHYGCEYFQDRSKFIELPCKLGDKVFYFDTAGRIYEQTISQFIYGGTGLKLDSDVMFDSELIGKRFFLSREEAEKALKEREKE